jgi:hypothetical protein
VIEGRVDAPDVLGGLRVGQRAEIDLADLRGAQTGAPQRVLIDIGGDDEPLEPFRGRLPGRQGEERHHEEHAGGEDDLLQHGHSGKTLRKMGTLVRCA